MPITNKLLIMIIMIIMIIIIIMIIMIIMIIIIIIILITLTQDFRDTKTLAEYLKWLGQHDDIYNMYTLFTVHHHASRANSHIHNMYLDWKVKGVSENFKWIMGISAVHSNCRCCGV